MAVGPYGDMCNIIAQSVFLVRTASVRVQLSLLQWSSVELIRLCPRSREDRGSSRWYRSIAFDVVFNH